MEFTAYEEMCRKQSLDLVNQALTELHQHNISVTQARTDIFCALWSLLETNAALASETLGEIDWAEHTSRHPIPPAP